MNASTDSLYVKLAKSAEYGRAIEREAVLSGLESTDAHVRWMATKVSGILRLSEAVGRLFELAETNVAEGEPDIPAIAVWSLGRFDPEDIVGRVTGLARSAESAKRRVAADLLGFVRRPDCLLILNELLMDEKRDVALWAALSMSKYGRDAIALLERAASSSSETYRVAFMLDALVKIGTSDSDSAIERAIAAHVEPTQTELRDVLTQLRTHNEFEKRQRSHVV